MKHGKVGEEGFFRPGVVPENGENKNSSIDSTRTIRHVQALGDNTEITIDEQISREHHLQSTKPAPPDVYAISRISLQSSGDDVKRVVRDKHIETHTDERRGQLLFRAEEDKIEEEARLVAWAANGMLNPE